MVTRIQTFLFPSQISYSHEKLSRQEIIARILREGPTVVLRKRYYWHIGNVLSLDKDGGYFAAGRTTKSMVEKYDEKSGNFIGEKLSDVDLEVNYQLAEG